MHSLRSSCPPALGFLGKLAGLVLVGIVAIFVVPLLGDGGESESGTSTVVSVTSGPLAASTSNMVELIAQAEALPVTDRVSVGYARDLFGDGWGDVDGNGCDTRNDVLARDLTDITLDGDGCTVLSGTLEDPYTGEVIEFTRGQDTSSAVQIDHIVPLAAAWAGGADVWSEQQRVAFANDPNNLLAVDGVSNSSKGASLPSQWLPDNVAIHCVYVAATITVLVDYELAVPESEKTALVDLASQCAA